MVRALTKETWTQFLIVPQTPRTTLGYVNPLHVSYPLGCLPAMVLLCTGSHPGQKVFASLWLASTAARYSKHAV